MNNEFAMMLAPMGCCTHTHGHVQVQRSTQSYHRDPRTLDALVEREQVVSVILRSKSLDQATRAKIETYFYRHERVASWHILTDERKDERAALFYANVISAARGLQKDGNVW